MSYNAANNADRNANFTSPETLDPDNLPQPLGWHILVRPYPVKQQERTSGLILHSEAIEFESYLTNIARVVSVGPCAWNRAEHRDSKGQYTPWAKVGDFITYARHTGARRNFKGVVYTLLNDEDVIERLPDPLVFDKEGFYQTNIPQEQLEKYNTIYNKDFKENGV